MEEMRYAILKVHQRVCVVYTYYMVDKWKPMGISFVETRCKTATTRLLMLVVAATAYTRETEMIE